MLIDGKWVDEKLISAGGDGAFKRSDSVFRGAVPPDTATSGRYHLYVAMACPWAHRALIMRTVKDLESHIDVSVAGSDMLENGWEFSAPGTTGDALFGSGHMHEIYTRADAAYTGRVTVPVLWDREEGTIVSNESADIVRIFNSAFDSLTGNHVDYYPCELREEIDRLNDLVYANVNNGVYRCGFATTQQAYESAFADLFNALDTLEALLEERRYLAGDRVTEADWRLLPTLLRFDPVYFGHFKCNLRRICDYTNLSGYMRELYQMPGIAETFDMASTKRHYYYSHDQVNPTRVVPAGPATDYDAPHGRGPQSG